MTGPTPFAALAEMGGYSPKRSLIHTPHRLDGNEGRPPPAALLSAVQEAGVECVRSYPNKRPLEALIAEAAEEAAAARAACTNAMRRGLSICK